jgi:hypothetical protein
MARANPRPADSPAPIPGTAAARAATQESPRRPWDLQAR